VALTSGDETIVNAWRACMEGRGGLTVTFTPVTPTVVQAKVEYFQRGSAPDDRITEIAALTGATAIEGRDCFRRGKRLVNRVPCRATLRLARASTGLPVSLNSREGGATAYLPGRIQLVSETKPYPFTEADRLGISISEQPARPKGRLPSATQTEPLDGVLTQVRRARPWSVPRVAV
jgi:hypothetical protein